MTNTCSDFGKELDSLADVITFGVAPSLLAFVWGFHYLPDSTNPELHQHLLQAGAFICFLFLLSGASRLARFNISQDAQPRNPGRPGRKYFVGMPIPAGAGISAATVHLFNGIPIPAWWVAVPWLLMVALCRFPDGEHVAILVGQGDQLLAQPPVPGAGAGGDRDVCDDPRLEPGDVRDWATYRVLGHWARVVYGWSRRRRRRAIAMPSCWRILRSTVVPQEERPKNGNFGIFKLQFS